MTSSFQYCAEATPIRFHGASVIIEPKFKKSKHTRVIPVTDLEKPNSSNIQGWSRLELYVNFWFEIGSRYLHTESVI